MKKTNVDKNWTLRTKRWYVNKIAQIQSASTLPELNMLCCFLEHVVIALFVYSCHNAHLQADYKLMDGNKNQRQLTIL